MEDILNSQAAVICLIASSFYFMIGLITGAWKYVAMAASENKVAPHYVSVAHRSSFSYASAAFLLGIFAYYSIFNETMNLVAVCVSLFFFTASIFGYIYEGLRDRTSNLIKDASSPQSMKLFMWLSILVEIAGVGVVIVGFYLRLLNI